MGLEYKYESGQTPIDDDEKLGLLISSIETLGELNELEQLNIEQAVKWTIANRVAHKQLLTEEFTKQLHRRMFDQVWRWAGTFRKSEKNIGVDASLISVELRKLLDDTIYWIENNVYPSDELTIRFKHRLVKTHCFPNGNGRHSRLMADVLIQSISDSPYFSWGGSNLVEASDKRRTYINAIIEADKNNIQPLLNFSRS